MKPTRGQMAATLLCLIPAAAALRAYLSGNLSANPIEDLTLRTGQAAVLFLLLSLTCTPLKNLFHLNFMIPVRKSLGLAAFGYAALHFLVFAGLDFEFHWAWIRDEILQKPFIQIGLAALILLLPLAITSLNRLQARMGNTWRLLHRLVYPIMALAIWHFYLASKGDILLPLIYAGLFLVLMLLRLPPLSKISIAKPLHWLQELDRFLLR